MQNAQDIRPSAAPPADPFSDIGDLLESGDNRDANRAYARSRASSQGLDPDFVDRLLTQESGYNRKAYNRSTGASGVGQMIPGTQRRFGVSDPFDAKANIDGSLTYLGQLHKRFNGDQRKVAAGYFAGEDNAEAALANPAKNPKTRAYVNAVAGNPFEGIDDLFEGSSPSSLTPRATLTGRPAVDDQRAWKEAHAPQPTVVPETRLAPRSSSFDIDQSVFSESGVAKPQAQFDFASKFPARTPAEQIADRAAAQTGQTPYFKSAFLERRRQRFTPRAGPLSTDQKISRLAEFAASPEAQAEFQPPANLAQEISVNTGKPVERRRLSPRAALDDQAAISLRQQQQEGASYLRTLPESEREAAARELAKRYPLSDEERELAGFGPLDWAAANVASPLASVAGRVISGAGRLYGAATEPYGELRGDRAPNAVEQFGRNIQASAQEGANIGGQGVIPQMTRAATEMGPLALLPGGVPVIAGEQALESYGAGAPALEAIKHGLTTGAAVALGGGLGQKFQAMASRPLTRYGARVAGLSTGMTAVNTAASGEFSPVEAARTFIFSLVYGLEGKPSDEAVLEDVLKRPERYADWHAAAGRVSQGDVSPDALASLHTASRRAGITEEGAANILHEAARAGATNRHRPAGELEPRADLRSSAVAPEPGPTSGSPIVHTPLNKSVDPELVRSEVGREVAAQGTPAIWRAAEGDIPVSVTRDLGVGPDGRRYVRVAGYEGGIPVDELASGPARPIASPQIAGSGVAENVASSGTANPATAPESNATLGAQLDSLRRARDERELAFGPELEQPDVTRRAVLVTPGEQMPATKGSLESEGFAVTRAVDENGRPVGTFIHDPREVSRQEVKRKAADGTFHELLGIIEKKSPTTTEAVVARGSRGEELQAAMASPRNVGRQSDALRAQFPESTISTERPSDVLAARETDRMLERPAQTLRFRDEDFLPHPLFGDVAAPEMLQALPTLGRSMIVPAKDGRMRVAWMQGKRPLFTRPFDTRPEAEVAAKTIDAIQSKQLGGKSPAEFATSLAAAQPIDAAAHEAATSHLNEQPAPTKPQIEAGNYKKGHVRIGGLDVSIENPEGSKRNPKWPALKSHYGYIRRTEAKDGEQIDAFIKPGTPEDYNGPVFVVDQQKANGAFDEHKAMLGWPDKQSARAGYAENFTPGWKVGPIRSFANVDDFRDWLRTADTSKPAAVTREPLTGNQRVREREDVGGKTLNRLRPRSSSGSFTAADRALAREQVRRSLADTKAGERQAREAGFLTVSEGRGGQPPTPPGGRYGGFEDPEMEARWNAAKGIRPEPLWARVKEKLVRLKNLATRDLEHLPRGAEHAELSAKLRQLAQGKGIASDEAVRILQGLTAKLNKEGYDLYTRRIILDDLLEETERQADAGKGDKELRLPFGFTPDSVLGESRRLDEALQQHPDVEEAVANRQVIIKEVTRDYLAAARSAIGFEPKLTRESYYRHQVLDYATALGKRVLGTGQKLGAPTGRGFLKKRKGSELDINTNYLQAEHSVLAQMLYDTEVFKLLRLVDDNYNLARAMKNEARQANARAIQKIIEAEERLPGNKPRARRKTQTLSQFVRAQGGIRDDGGDEVGRLKLKESGTTGLVTKGGKTPDVMREAAVEAGFLFDEPDSTYATHADNFLNAVEDDLRGIRTRYSGEHIDDVIADNEPLIFATVGRQMKIFKSKIGRGFAELRSLASDGTLWTGENNEWETAVQKLQAIRNYDEDLSDDRSAFKYLAALAANDAAEGNLQARIILKAIGDRRAFVKQTLGEKFKTWKDFLPESHSLWQPREGNVLYNTYSLPEKLVTQAMESAYEAIGFNSSDLRRAMVMGGKRTEFAIPDEVAATLNDFMKPRDTNPLDQGVRAMVRAWKVWQLISPHRFFKYNSRNVSGDADAVFVGNPSAFRKSGKAIHDLYGYLGRKSAPTPELQEWLERGGLYNLFQVAEDVGSINGLKVFRNLKVDKNGNIQKMNPWKQYWRAARISTDFREAILRYGAFLDYREQVKGNKGQPKNYGASIPEEVNALRDPSDKAFKLSNDLLGAYNEVTVFGQWLRTHLQPFWSWQEVNAKRYYRLFKNSIYESKSTADAGRKILGKAARVSPFVAFRIGKFLLKAAGLWAMLAAYNNLVWPDEEKDLDEKTRARVHIILGRRADGSVIYFDRLGMLGDFLSWFGLDEAPHLVADFLNNKRTAKEIAIEMAKAPVNKFWNGTGIPKTAAEFAMGRNTFPDVFRSRSIRSRWQYLFQSFGLGDEYAALTGKPTRGAGRVLTGLFVYEVDPGESAYNELMSLKSDFNQKRGKAADVAAGNDKSNAAYYLKLALRYGDIASAKASLAEYKALGGTPQGLQASIKALAPLSGLSEADKAEFLKTLTSDERARLAKAQAFYESVLDRSDEVGPADLLARPIAKQIREPVDKELHRLGVSFPYPQSEVTLGGARQEVPKAEFEEFQQRVAETTYEQLGDMISKPHYQRLSDADKKLALEDFSKAWSGNEHRRLHGRLVLRSGAQGLERVDAEMEGLDARQKEQELRNKELFFLNRRIERTLHPRSKIQLGEQ